MICTDGVSPGEMSSHGLTIHQLIDDMVQSHPVSCVFIMLCFTGSSEHRKFRCHPQHIHSTTRLLPSHNHALANSITPIPIPHALQNQVVVSLCRRRPCTISQNFRFRPSGPFVGPLGCKPTTRFCFFGRNHSIEPIMYLLYRSPSPNISS